jgi:hypothetical protein
MYHYDAKLALEELQEDALLPHPVKLRDMILRTKLGPTEAQALNLPDAFWRAAKNRAQRAGETCSGPTQSVLMP